MKSFVLILVLILHALKQANAEKVPDVQGWTLTLKGLQKKEWIFTFTKEGIDFDTVVPADENYMKNAFLERANSNI